MLSKRLLFAVVCLLVVDVCFGGGHLFPCGLEDGDTEFPAGDDTSHLFTMNSPFSFFGTPYTSLYFGSNGVISTVPYTDYTPNGDIGNPMDYPDPIMAVFHDDLKDNSMGAYARDSTDAGELAAADAYVAELFSAELPTFTATELTIFTWNRFSVFNPDVGTDPVMSFQAVLVRSAAESVVLYLYENVNLFKRDFPVIGVTNANNVNHKSVCVSNTNTADTVDEAGQGATTCGLYGFIVDGAAILTDNTCIAPGSVSCSDDAFDACTPPDPLMFPDHDLRFDENVCENCIVSNGLGFNSFKGDCSCFWMCVLPPSFGAEWVSLKRCCPCDTVWSQKLLTCVEYTDMVSDCWREDPTTFINPCEGLPDDTFLERQRANSTGVLCAGYIRCVTLGPRTMPKLECCPDDQCFDKTVTSGMPCTTSACGTIDGCSEVDDCECIPDEFTPTECPYTSSGSDNRQFIGDNSITFTCASGTIWDDDKCTCVSDNTINNECDAWLDLDFDGGTIEAVSGQGNSMWSHDEGVTVLTPGADSTSNYVRFDGDGDYINLAALANAYIGNTFVMRFYFRLETNAGAPGTQVTQRIVQNCFDEDGTSTGTDFPNIAVNVVRDATTGNGNEVETRIRFNTMPFMTSSSMATIAIDLDMVLPVDTWFEYWLIYCGDENLIYNGVLDASGSIVGSVKDVISSSYFVLISPSGFVFGTSSDSAIDDYDGCVDEILMYRCKPTGDSDFDTDYAALVAANI